MVNKDIQEQGEIQSRSGQNTGFPELKSLPRSSSQILLKQPGPRDAILPDISDFNMSIKMIKKQKPVKGNLL